MNIWPQKNLVLLSVLSSLSLPKTISILSPSSNFPRPLQSRGRSKVMLMFYIIPLIQRCCCIFTLRTDSELLVINCRRLPRISASEKYFLRSLAHHENLGQSCRGLLEFIPITIDKPLKTVHSKHFISTQNWPYILINTYVRVILRAMNICKTKDLSLGLKVLVFSTEL